MSFVVVIPSAIEGKVNRLADALDGANTSDNDPVEERQERYRAQAWAMVLDDFAKKKLFFVSETKFGYVFKTE